MTCLGFLTHAERGRLARTRSPAKMAAKEPEQVIVHPLVLLNVVDHYNRVAKDTQRRVVGILLGESDKGRVDCTNSFAVPFEEDARDKTVWFLDHDFLEEMAHMFKVGWWCWLWWSHAVAAAAVAAAVVVDDVVVALVWCVLCVCLLVLYAPLPVLPHSLVIIPH